MRKFGLFFRKNRGGTPGNEPAKHGGEGSFATVADGVSASAAGKNANEAKLSYQPSSWRMEIPARCDDGFIKLVILSVSHRTGSTLLQRLCNARKGTLIWGEHGGLLRHYAEIYRAAAFFSVHAGGERADYFQSGEDPNVWTANMTPDLPYAQEATVESARMFLNALYREHSDDHDLIGFKEVAYRGVEAELIRRCYPKASFLLIVRHPADMWNSTKRRWYASLETWMKKWNDNTRDFLELSRNDPLAHFLRYEDIVRREKKALAVIADVARITAEQIEGVLKNKVGSNPVGISDRERETICAHCRESMDALGYS